MILSAERGFTVAENSHRNVQLAQLAAQLTEAWNSHDPRRVAALCAPDYEGENVERRRLIAGRLGWLRRWQPTWLPSPIYASPSKTP